MSSSKDSLPPFLLYNIDVVEKLKDYLTMLSVKVMSEYIHDSVIPTIVKHRYGVDKKSTTYMDTVKVISIREYFSKYNIKMVSSPWV